MELDAADLKRKMPHDIQVFRPRKVRNHTYHWLGLSIMTANLVRHKIRGYRTPRPRTSRNAREGLDYARAVVNNWVRHLLHYSAKEGVLDATDVLEDRDVLELGPGSDLGAGMLLMARGCHSYTGVDAFPLLHRTPKRFQLEMARLMTEEAGKEGSSETAELASAIEEQVELFLNGEYSRLHYRHLPDFDLSRLKDKSFDLIVSHSAFEHVRDVRRTIEQMSELARPGAHFAAEIDLQTHTRWIRDADPLNIYRYAQRVYQGMSFSGAPNRARPDEYMAALDANGWTNPRIYPKRVLESAYVRRVAPSLSARFRDDPEQLGWLSIVLCATRKGERWSKPRPR